MSTVLTTSRAASRLTLFRRIRRDENGATVVEFALVLPMFLVMLFAIFEVGLHFFKQLLLDNALQTAAREILVGTTQTAMTPGNEAAVEAAFKTAVCNNSFFFRTSCNDVKLQVLIGSAEINANRDPWAAVNGATNPPTITIPGTQSFNPLPASSEDVVVRVYAPTKTFIARINGIGMTMQNGNAVLVSSTAFRVEPFMP
jgi:Flp pilus assembly protein TadG